MLWPSVTLFGERSSVMSSLKIFDGKWWQRFSALCLVLLALLPTGALAQNNLEMTVTRMDGFGRMILSFPGELELPEYELRSENGVLSIEFAEPVNVALPDVALELPDFVAISRVDPDRRGIRFGLKAELRINKIEAGEELYIDFLPPDWVGLPPSLPQDVVTRLARRANDAAELAEQRRKAELARQNNPTAELQVGQNPTFIRLEFTWNVDTVTEYSFEDGVAELKFAWPVPIDLYALDADLPPEIERATSDVTPDGNILRLQVADDVEPRFYKLSERQYIVDLDRLEPNLETVTAEDLLEVAEAEAEARRLVEMAENPETAALSDGPDTVPTTDQTELTPRVSRVGSSIRIAFPFEVETPAAVFRRGDMVWMVFDSTAGINAPEGAEILTEVSDDFSAVSAGDTQIVRMQLNPDRLASLGSQGVGWVISIGDVTMAASEPIRFNRRETREGLFEISADLDRPARVHDVRDPVVGDVLEVVTMFPPARGLVRDLDYVDFEALRSVHGLVIRPINDSLQVTLSQRAATLSTDEGLTVSSFVESRSNDSGDDPVLRRGFVDLVQMEEPNPGLLNSRIATLAQEAAISEGREQDALRLQLAETFLANRLANESIGVLNVLIDDNGAADQFDDAQVVMAAAFVTAGRTQSALELLNSPLLVDAVDGLMWRSIARSDAEDFEGARVDALAAESVVVSYPDWVRNMFLLSGIESAVETGDLELAHRLDDKIVYSELASSGANRYELLQGRIDELEQRYDSALDTYGHVIAADVRPTRVEAVFRTISLLDKMGRLDAVRAAETLATEAMIWRGGPLEAKILGLLARLQFRSGDFRGAFATVRNASIVQNQTDDIGELNDMAQEVFAALYLDGEADALEPIDALTLYYDYRQLTPPGARGDEMIRNLARRLIRVDLLEQAADLLEYQIDTRLEGAARAQVAADLAIIRIADRTPEAALNVLNRTALANLSPSLERQRRILEARALVDAGRSQLALDVLRNLDGRDADMMRVDAMWRDGMFREAAEQIELMYTPRGSVGVLAQAARLNIIRAGAGFVLANDRIGLTRLRSKFADVMADSPEWPMFDYVTSAVTRTSDGFRDLAGEIAARDSLSGFLAAYQQTYGADGALAPSSGVAQSG